MSNHAVRADAPAKRRGDDAALSMRLGVSVVLTAAVFFAELAGGYFFNSLALMSDAAHVFMDALSLGLSWFAIYISKLPPSEKRTFGLHRVEVFAAFTNSVSLFIITLFISYKAYLRLLDPVPVNSAGTLAIAVVGLIVNLAVVFWLKSFSERDLNVKSAFLHVIGDTLASVGVIVGAGIIYFTGWNFVDPVISMLICLIILWGAAVIIKDSSHILLEGVPKEIDLGAVLKGMKDVQGVDNVHSLHIWSICHNVYALSAHVDIAPVEKRRQGEILGEINERLARTHHIFYTTLQAECTNCEPGNTLRRLSHRGHEHLH